MIIFLGHFSSRYYCAFPSCYVVVEADRLSFLHFNFYVCFQLFVEMSLVLFILILVYFIVLIIINLARVHRCPSFSSLFSSGSTTDVSFRVLACNEFASLLNLLSLLQINVLTLVLWLIGSFVSHRTVSPS